MGHSHWFHPINLRNASPNADQLLRFFLLQLVRWEARAKVATFSPMKLAPCPLRLTSPNTIYGLNITSKYALKRTSRACQIGQLNSDGRSGYLGRYYKGFESTKCYKQENARTQTQTVRLRRCPVQWDKTRQRDNSHWAHWENTIWHPSSNTQERVVLW